MRAVVNAPRKHIHSQHVSQTLDACDNFELFFNGNVCTHTAHIVSHSMYFCKRDGKKVKYKMA